MARKRGSQEESSTGTQSTEVSPEVAEAFAKVAAGKSVEADTSQTEQADTSSPTSAKRKSTAEEFFKEDGDEEAQELKTEKKEDETTEDEKEPDTDGTQEEAKPLDDDAIHRLVQAGRRAKLSDDKIEALIQDHPEILESMASMQDQVSQLHAEKGRQSKKADSKKEDASTDSSLDALLKPLELKYDPEDLDADFVEGILKPIQAQNEAMRKVIAELAKGKAAPEEAAEADDGDVVSDLSPDVRVYLDNYFDGKAKSLPQFGSSKSMTEAQGAARNAVCVLAQSIGASWNATHPRNPMTIDQALDKAIELETGQTAAMDKLVAKVKASQKRLTNRPTNRNVNKTYKTDTEEAVANVKAYMEAKGLQPQN